MVIGPNQGGCPRLWMDGVGPIPELYLLYIHIRKYIVVGSMAFTQHQEVAKPPNPQSTFPKSHSQYDPPLPQALPDHLEPSLFPPQSSHSAGRRYIFAMRTLIICGP